MTYLLLVLPLIAAAALLLRRLAARHYITLPARPDILPRDVPDGNPDSL